MARDDLDTRCLDPSAASQFVEGLAGAVDVARIEAHVAECRDCRELLAAMVSSSDVGEEPIEGDEPAAQDDAPIKSASAASFLEPGTEVGRFIIRESLGRGGMGVVYRAHDPELDRDVAIKLLRFDYRGERAGEAEARLLREARAMARLSHPNVVTVYEVGSELGYVFIAMELLAGQTLDVWLASAPRSIDEIVGAFSGAGRGLHAAHGAGLVHRDFKPSNVIVDDSGKAVVLDFGLVAGDELVDENTGTDRSSDRLAVSVGSSSGGSSSGGSLTRTGALLGTPAYMAPEQHLGEPVGPRTDQWAFAVSLYQALAEEHPFGARELQSLRKKVLAGAPRPLSSKLPARIRRATMRGLAREKSERFESMAAMVRALEGDPGRPWLWAVLAVVVVTAFAAILVIQSRPDSALCRGGEARVADLWNPTIREQLVASFTSQPVPFAKKSAAAVSKTLDTYFARWATLHRETCEAARVRQELSEPAMERAMGCLERRLDEASALQGLLLRADRAVVANAEEAAGQLTDPGICQDRNRLSAIALEPTGAEELKSLDAMRQQLAEVKALIGLGRISEGLVLARAQIEPAGKLDYAVATAEVNYELGRALEAAGLYADADAALRESLYAALGAADDRQVILAAIALVRVVGFRKADVESGEAWHRIARASLRRAGDDDRLSRELDAAQARLLAAAGKFAEAESIATAVLDAAVKEHGEANVRVASAHAALGSYCGDQYRYDCAEKNFKRALELWTAHHGPEHPAVASALTDLGSAAAAQGKFDVALTHHRRAIEIREKGLGPEHPDLGRSYHNIGYPLIATGKLDEALEACQRALAITRASLGPDHPRNAATLYTMGYLYWVQKKYDDAYTAHQRALALRTAAFGAEHAYVGDIHIELGRTRRDQERYADAAEHYDRSLAIRRRELGSGHEKTVYTMTDLASMHVLLDAPERALPLLEEANLHWKRNTGGNTAMMAMNSFFLARALWESGGSKSRARALARESLAGYREAKDPEAVLRAERWLATH